MTGQVQLKTEKQKKTLVDGESLLIQVSLMLVAELYGVQIVSIHVFADTLCSGSLQRQPAILEAASRIKRAPSS